VCSNVFSKALCSKCVMNQMCYEPNEFKTQVEHNTSGTQHFWNTLFTKHIETHTLHTLYFRRAHMHARTHARYEFARESVGISDQTTYPPPPPPPPPKWGPHEKWNPRKMEICRNFTFSQKSVGIERTALPVNMMPIIELTVRQLRVCRAKTYFAWEIQYMP